MKKMLITAVLAIVCSGFGVPALAQYNPNLYHNGLQQQNVLLGTVVAVRPVQGQGGQTIGAAVGGVAGAAIGHQVGQGIGKTVATAVGALFGAIAGGHIQQSVTTQSVADVTVRLNSGRLIAVVEHGYLRPGQHVQVIYSGNTVRVMPL